MAIKSEYVEMMLNKVQSGEITRKDIETAMAETKLELEIKSASASGRKFYAAEIVALQDELDSANAALAELDKPVVETVETFEAAAGITENVFIDEVVLTTGRQTGDMLELWSGQGCDFYTKIYAENSMGMYQAIRNVLANWEVEQYSERVFIYSRR